MRKGRYRDIGSDTLGREIDRQCTRERVCIRERERERERVLAIIFISHCFS